MPEGFELLSKLAGMEMGRALSRGPLTDDQHFFDSGGDSLRAVEVVAGLVQQQSHAEDERTAEELYADLLITIFDDPTPRALAVVLQRHLARSSGVERDLL